MNTESGSCTLETSHPFLVFEASKAQPHRVIFQNPPLYFFVPADARAFDLVVECGGITEPAAVKVLDPEGRAAVEAEGALMGRRLRVTPRPGTRGKVWQLVVAPREDVSCHLEGDVLPYLADHPARLLTRRAP